METRNHKDLWAENLSICQILKGNELHTAGYRKMLNNATQVRNFGCTGDIMFFVISIINQADRLKGGLLWV